MGFSFLYYANILYGLENHLNCFAAKIKDNKHKTKLGNNPLVKKKWMKLEKISLWKWKLIKPIMYAKNSKAIKIIKNPNAIEKPLNILRINLSLNIARTIAKSKSVITIE